MAESQHCTVSLVTFIIGDTFGVDVRGNMVMCNLRPEK